MPQQKTQNDPANTIPSDWCTLTLCRQDTLFSDQTLSNFTELRKAGIEIPDTLQHQIPQEKTIPYDQKVFAFIVNIVKAPGISPARALYQFMIVQGYEPLLIYDFVRYIEHYYYVFRKKKIKVSTFDLFLARSSVYVYEDKKILGLIDPDKFLITEPKDLKNFITLWVKKN